MLPHCKVCFGHGGGVKRATRAINEYVDARTNLLREGSDSLVELDAGSTSAALAFLLAEGQQVVASRENVDDAEGLAIAREFYAFFGREDRRVGVVTGEGEVVDIDSRADMLVADAILRERQGAVE